MKRLLIFVLGMGLLALYSCTQNTGPESNESEEIAAIEQMLSDSTEIMYDALDDESEANIMADDPNWLGGSSLAKTSELKTRWGRIKKHPVDRSIQIVLDAGDTTATAYIKTIFEGIFIVKKAEQSGDTVNYDRYEKTAVHSIERIVKLRKVRDTENPRLNWKVVEVSMKEGASETDGVEIVEMMVKASGQDSVVITDPLEYFQNGVNIFTFPRLTTDVQVTVKVKNIRPADKKVFFPEGSEATETVVLHYGRGNRSGRLHFARSWFDFVGKDNEGNNVYKGTWSVKQFQGIHHAVIDVVDNGTIYERDESEYPYISSTWATLYRVTRF